MNGAASDSKRFAATVGMFDGVHRGHQFLLSKLKETAEERGLVPLVFTFSRHPLETIAPGRCPKLITSPEQRTELIRELTGIRSVEILDPTPQFLRATGREFLEELHRRFAVDVFVMGFNNRIGSDKATAASLRVPEIETVSLPPLESGTAVNSTAVRAAIETGDIQLVDSLLGHRWKYRGRVVEGKQLGRTIGFPTANIRGEVPGLILPPNGVYAVDATLADGNTLRGMANIGHRPTVDAVGAPASFEVNIFDYDADLYGQTVDIAFLARMRDEKRFDSIEDLRLRLEADRCAARKL